MAAVHAFCCHVAGYDNIWSLVSFSHVGLLERRHKE